MPKGNNLNLATILEGQAKMQQEFADLKKRSADEMVALRQENSKLRRKIEVDLTQKRKNTELPTPQPTKEESEYNHIPRTTTTHHSTSISTHHTTTVPVHHSHTLPTHNTTNPLTTHILPHHCTSTFPTIIRYPIPPDSRHPFIYGITETQYMNSKIFYHILKSESEFHMSIVLKGLGLDQLK